MTKECDNKSLGRYIVIEGPHGVGKTVQIQALYKKLSSIGLPVKIFNEPDSQISLTARTIQRIIKDPNYIMNSKTQFLLYNAARFQTLKIIKQNINQGINCLVDGNFLTTLINFYYTKTTKTINYETINQIIDFSNNDLEPDVCIVLDAPTNTLKERSKNNLSDDFIIEKIRSGYLWEAHQRNYPIIFAINDIDSTTHQIWQKIVPVFEKNYRSNTHKNVITTTAPPVNPPLIIENNLVNHKKLTDQTSTGNKYITKEGKQLLNKLLINNKSNLYLFKKNVNSDIITPLISKVNQSSDNFKIVLLDILTKLNKNNQTFINKSIKEISHIYVIVDNSSYLLNQKIKSEIMNSGFYYEQSTKEKITFNSTKSKKSNPYFIPKISKPDIKQQYIKIMNDIYCRYEDINNKLLKYLAIYNKNKINDEQLKKTVYNITKNMLPIATKKTIFIAIPVGTIKNIISTFLNDPITEIKQFGVNLLDALKEYDDFYLQDEIFVSDNKLQTTNLNLYKYITEVKNILSNEKISNNYDSELSLVDYYPKNELDIVPDLIYTNASIDMKRLKNIVNNWGYDIKSNILKQYLTNKLITKQILKKISYNWDLLCDFQVLRELQELNIISNLSWQDLTPRYGFKINKNIEDAGLTSLYEQNFYDSLKLHSLLIENKQYAEAQYVTLIGHKNRFKFNFNAENILNTDLFSKLFEEEFYSQNIILTMYQKIFEIHPIITENMYLINNRAVNKKITTSKLFNLTNVNPKLK